MDNSRYARAMLLDFYGDLLTEKQRECFDLHYNEDLSLSEIAEQLGISRQGVWDNIRRADSALAELEEKTGLLARFEANTLLLEGLLPKLERLAQLSSGEARELAEEAISELKSLTDRG